MYTRLFSLICGLNLTKYNNLHCERGGKEEEEKEKQGGSAYLYIYRYAAMFQGAVYREIEGGDQRRLRSSAMKMRSVGLRSIGGGIVTLGDRVSLQVKRDLLCL